MKLFTRFVAATGFLLLQAFAAWAATFTVQVGPNGSLVYQPAALTIQPGDQVTFQWQSGNHPTQLISSPGATSPAWSSFQMSASSTTQTFTFNAVGRYEYVCVPHSSLGMVGTITVAAPTPTREGTKQAAAQLHIFPNPVRGGEATLTMGELKAGQAYRLRVTNIIGREVQSVALRPETLSAGQAINFSALPAGLYICSVLSNDKVLATKRVTVQN